MTRIITILAALVLTTGVWAQAPQKMSYQAVIRNSTNVLVTTTTVGMRISVLQGSASGTAVYVETQTASTNANGLVSLEIGGGTPVTGTFAGINWAAGPYFIKTETDPTGGSSYTITGTSQLMSVPYALYSAKTAAPAVTTVSGLINSIPFGSSAAPWVQAGPAATVTVVNGQVITANFSGVIGHSATTDNPIAVAVCYQDASVVGAPIYAFFQTTYTDATVPPSPQRAVVSANGAA